MTVDATGYLVAKSDFDEPVGPSFWERDERDDIELPKALSGTGGWLDERHQRLAGSAS